jgi:NAD(P)-dependent dehydrogenase (short-subunit alcohol dehydrogenase family)
MGIEGQVAFVTGAGRGQGRAHARTLARNGASVVITDIGAEKVSTVPYPLSDSSDLE